jgi:hypothetical protein
MLSTPLPNPVVELARKCLFIGKQLRAERWFDEAGNRLQQQFSAIVASQLHPNFELPHGSF